MKIAISLISAKFKNSIETLKILPHSGNKLRAIAKQKREIQELAENPPKAIYGLLGVEGRAAFAYSPKILSSIGERGPGDPNDLHYLGGKMGEHYVLQNFTYPRMRHIVGLCYVAGGLLLFIPTAWTFGQVLYQVLG